MKKLVNKLVIFFMVLVILCVLGLVALTYYFNPSRVKPMVESYVQEQYKRKISIGDVSWRVFPRLGISIKEVTLGNAPGFGEGDFAKLGSATIFVDTMKLFSGKVHVSQLELLYPTADLKVNAQGLSNWADLTQSKANTTAKAAEPAPAENSRSISDIELNIEKIEILNGAFTYQDDKTGEKYEIKNLGFLSSNVGLGKFFPVDLRLMVSSNAPALSADVHLKGTLQLPAKTTTYDLSTLTINAELVIQNLLANGIKVSSLQTPMKLDKGVLDLTAVKADLYGGNLNGSIRVDAKSKPADVLVNYDMKGTDITSLTRDLGVKQNFSGKLNMKGNLRFKTYPDRKQLSRNLTGTASMNIHNGALLGVDLAYWYNTGIGLLKSRNVSQLALGAVQAVAGATNTGKTDFVGAWANFNLNNGLITNKDLNVYTEKVYGLGAGTINLVNETIDYRFNISGVSKTGNEYKPSGQAIPLIISGSLSNPKMNVDVGASVGQVLKNVVTSPSQGQPQSGSQPKGVGGQLLQQILQ